MGSSPMTVWVIKGFTWGAMTQDEADENVGTVVRLLERATKRDRNTNEDVPIAQVEVVEREELTDRLGSYPRADIVVFPSRGALEVAKKLAAQPHCPKVVVLTGLIPDGEVQFVDKGWDPDTIREAILGR